MGIKVTQAITKALEANKTLKHLNLSHIGLSNEEVILIAKAIEKNEALIYVDLSFNRMKVKGAEAVARALELNKNITFIDLSHNSMKGAEVAVIVVALEVNRTLTSVRLGNNTISSEVIRAVAKVLEVNKTLASINLGYDCMSIEGLDTIIKALEINETILDLGFKSSEVSYEGIEHVIKDLRMDEMFPNFRRQDSREVSVAKKYLERNLKLFETKHVWLTNVTKDKRLLNNLFNKRELNNVNGQIKQQIDMQIKTLESSIASQINEMKIEDMQILYNQLSSSVDCYNTSDVQKEITRKDIVSAKEEVRKIIIEKAISLSVVKDSYLNRLPYEILYSLFESKFIANLVHVIQGSSSESKALNMCDSVLLRDKDISEKVSHTQQDQKHMYSVSGYNFIENQQVTRMLCTLTGRNFKAFIRNDNSYIIDAVLKLERNENISEYMKYLREEHNLPFVLKNLPACDNLLVLESVNLKEIGDSVTQKFHRIT